jgi:hypothetical protein
MARMMKTAQKGREREKEMNQKTTIRRGDSHFVVSTVEVPEIGAAALAGHEIAVAEFERER